MIKDLSNFVFFLHGLSGSGKGEMQRVLVEKFHERGYEISYTSSGDLFRDVLDDPKISAQVNQGIFLNTLGAIIPGLERELEGFINDWAKRDLKQILILDGFIRRTDFETDEGEAIPSQLEQVSDALDNVLRKLKNDDEIEKLFPEYSAKGKNETLQLIVDSFKSAWHFLTSIHPSDAEDQMIGRSQKQLDSIMAQAESLSESKLITTQQKAIVDQYVLMFMQILHGGIKVENGQIIRLPQDEWRYSLNQDEYQMVFEEVKRLTKSLAEELGTDDSSSLPSIFSTIGISTQLRSDDLPDLGRKKRIENYISNYMLSLEKDKDITKYTSGFSSIALTKDFNFSFNDDGSFTSRSKKCIVIPNGKLKSVNLETFQQNVDQVVRRIVDEVDRNRKSVKNEADQDDG